MIDVGRLVEFEVGSVFQGRRKGEGGGVRVPSNLDRNKSKTFSFKVPWILIFLYPSKYSGLPTALFSEVIDFQTF